MVKDAAIKAEMIMINGMEERLSNSIRSKSLAKNNSWKYFLFKSSTLRIGFFGKIKKNSSKLKSSGMASDKIENLPDSKDIRFSFSFKGLEINSSAVKTNSESLV